MKKRYHCEFKNCECIHFVEQCNNICIYCKHANIWHSLNSRPPTDSYLSFISTRSPARRPIYVKKNIKVNIFMPEVPPLPESEDEIVFCEAIEILPV